MPTYIVIYRSIHTEIWEVEAECLGQAENSWGEKGHMVCEPLYEEIVKASAGGKYVFPEGKFPDFVRVS